MIILLSAFLVLYTVSLQTSMAGMEIFGWTTAVLGLANWIHRYRKTSFSEFKRQIYVPWLDLALLGLLFSVSIGILLVSPEVGEKYAMFGGSRWIALFIFLRIALRQIEFEKTEKHVRTLMILTGIIGAYCIYQYFTGHDLIRGPERKVLEHFGDRADGSPYFRAAGFFSMPTTFAHSMAQWACLPLAYLITHKGVKSGFRLLTILISVLAAFGVVLSLTRGAWISFPCAVLFMVVFARRRWLVPVLVAMTIGTSGIYIFMPEVAKRSSTILNTADQSHSNNERLAYWRINLEMFKEHPLFGIGYNLNETFSKDYLNRLDITGVRGGDAHNTYLQYLGGTGLTGFSFYMIFIIGIFIASLRTFRWISPEAKLLQTLALAAIGAQVATHIGGLTDCNFKDLEVNHSFIFILSCVLTLYVSRRTDVAFSSKPAS